MVVLGAAAMWIAAVVGGLGVLARYAATGQEPTTAPGEWPAASAIVRPQGEACAVVFLHPRCPCSAATLGELSRVLARTPRNARVVAAFFAPSSEPAGWGRTALRSRAEAIPGVTVVEDPDGREARLFGAAKSGHVVAYGSDGSLSFCGGITASRGHEGDNAGADGLLASLSGRAPGAPASPVYGCEITSAECPLCEAKEMP